MKPMRTRIQETCTAPVGHRVACRLRLAAVVWTAVAILALAPIGRAAGAAPAAEPAWVLPPAPPLSVLAVRGLWHGEYRLEEALARCATAFVDDVWVWDGCGSGWIGPGGQGGGGVIDFPGPEALMRHHVVIVANTNAPAFGAHQQVLMDYVKHGGAVLFLGGRFSFGKQYRESSFAAMMPVEFPGQQRWGSDLQAVDTGLDVLPGKDSIGAGFGTLPWADKPAVFWYHDVVPKADAKVLLTAGGKPLLVVGTFGQGRVGVFAGTVMGEPPVGRLPFWQWSGWPRLLGTTVAWLAEAPAQKATGGGGATRDAITAALGNADTKGLDDTDKPQATAAPELARLLLTEARACRSAESAAFLLNAAAKAPGDLPPGLVEEIGLAVVPFAPAESAKAAQALLATGLPYKTALAARVLGAARAAGSVAILEALYRSGEPPKPAAAGADDLDLDKGLTAIPTLKAVPPKEQAQMQTAIRLAALQGLGAIGDAPALAVVRKAVADLAGDGAPKPKEYADTLSDANRLYQEALLAALRCGDDRAAAPLVGCLLENVYMISRARTEANKSKDRLARLQQNLPALIAWQQSLCRELRLLPDRVLPAVAEQVAGVQDRRVAPVAFAAFAGRALPAPAAAALAKSPVPAVAALGGQ